MTDSDRSTATLDPNRITLWRSVGPDELDAVASSGWRAWPPRPVVATVADRQLAVRICREQTVPAEGAGHVIQFDVDRRFLDRFEVGQGTRRDEREYRIPANAIADLNAHIIGAIEQESEYGGPVDDAEFAETEEALGTPLPQAWRNYLQGRSWFRRGWMTSGAYVWLNTPREMLGLHEAWDEATGAHPGIAIIGGDGSREQLVLDLRRDPAPVLTVDIASAGWDSGILQADNVGQLIDRIESGEFEFRFDDVPG
ncbi:SMI1/KNR4 family protein [Actinoplanes derwentensis]|uniref:SMI1 / KNR4 family (SUKH-1) n=1 Tax=Actinoplanes derwentensis TaxID=113562 RepID=A0A1H1Z679_9ACTN|nr:SMI1/KNR4 family protein [Actinoplanes derwentensis]GID81457.1 hypothetical protein Ade03nite_03810 [Actinoplanes derwentensis]SDT29234.1 hypothetical protein SAMN04489716_3164 [Actinoplanes derwentensis]